MRKALTVLLGILLAGSLAACGTEQLLAEAQEAVDSYNSTAEAYNEQAGAYNDAIALSEAANAELQESIDAAQEAINRGEDPFDPATLENLKSVLADASSAKKSVPEPVETAEILSVSEDAKRDELNALIEQATTGEEELAGKTVPQPPEVPDYSETIAQLDNARVEYENSIQGLKQVTAPSDEFVMERLQRIETITEMAPVTEDNDPNGQLNKQGGYIGCIYFRDTQVDRSLIYIEDGKDGVLDVCTEGGGAVEIFATVEEANARNEYLGAFDGGMFASGSHYVVGTCVVRTSDHLNGTQQKDLTAMITEVLTAVD